MTNHGSRMVPRRDVLKTIGLGVGLGAAGTAWMSRPAAAISHTTPVLLATGTDNAIYEIDVSGGSPSATKLLDTGKEGDINLNGNGYDAGTGRFYFTQFDGNSSASNLWVVDLTATDPTPEPAGTLDGGAASGTFFDGAYYYVENGSDDLKKVTLNAAGKKAGEALVTDILGDTGLNFGDIVFRDSETLYFSAKKTDSGEPVTGVLDPTDASNYTDWDVGQLQLALDSEGTLYGHNANDGAFYTIDTASGALTSLGSTTLTFTDLASTWFFCETYPLCAGQDIDVGSVRVSDDGETLRVTYDIEEPWLLYETHLHVGCSTEDFPLAGRGNPKVGRFEYSKTHEGVRSYTYEVDIDTPDCNGAIYIATHAVVRPEDGCADFGSFVGESVEGMETVTPLLDIQSGYDDGEVIGSVDSTIDPDSPFYYGSDETVGDASGRENGCLDPAGFADQSSTGASGDHGSGGRPHQYVFAVADGYSLTDFSLRMLDFGDFNPATDDHHLAEMVARDADGNVVHTDTLEYWSDGKTNPVAWYPTEAKDEARDRTLTDAGDACNAEEGEPGNYVWSVSGDGIVEIELAFGKGYDPNIAFRDLCFTAQDETAWTCPGAEDVMEFAERGNWATYFEYTSPCE